MSRDIETERAVTWTTTDGPIRVHYDAPSETFRAVTADPASRGRHYLSVAHLIRAFGEPAAEQARAIAQLRLSATHPTHFPLES